MIQSIQLYQIERWSNFEAICAQLLEYLGETLFCKVQAIEARPGYLQLTFPAGNEGRISETLRNLPVRWYSDLAVNVGGKLMRRAGQTIA